MNSVTDYLFILDTDDTILTDVLLMGQNCSASGLVLGPLEDTNDDVHGVLTLILDLLKNGLGSFSDNLDNMWHRFQQISKLGVCNHNQPLYIASQSGDDNEE